MTARTVVLWPDSRLFKKTKLVSSFSEALEHAQDLYHTMVVSYGAGLASTQIGGDMSMCVIDNRYVPSLNPDEKLDGNCVVLINPTVTPSSNKVFQWEERCLSVPDVGAIVKRSSDISLEYFDLSGVHHKVDLSEIESATVQHEVDHLFGRLFIHRLEGFSRHRVMKKLQKREKLKRVQNSSEDVKIGRPKRNRKKKPKNYGKSKKR